MGNNTKPKIEYETIKLSKEIIQRVRDNKKKTHVPISIFFQEAAEEKLQKEKK
jgi:hypothetical protein